MAKYSTANPNDVISALRKRNLYSSKRDNGNVVVIGGSKIYHGAPALASNAAYSVLAALRTGAGYARAFVPKDVAAAVRCVSPDVIVEPLKGSRLSSSDSARLSMAIDHADSLIIGNGLGRNAQSLKASCKLIGHAIRMSKGVVVDADAIYAAMKCSKGLSGDLVMTPNDREFSLFSKKELDPKDVESRASAAMRLSARLNCIILLKGHLTIITNGKKCKVVSPKSSALAVMGTGDVLAGIIGGLLAINHDAFASAVAGACIHAAAGDYLYKRMGNHILASDVVGCIPNILKGF
ncbi:MAG: NAD(P)H-hydrate dehydratase [Candidatus Micrarchaeaceae archaeon]